MQNYLYRNLILYSLILIGPLKPCVYRYTVKNIPIRCHKQTNLHSTCLDPKKCHEQFTGGVLQNVLSGSTRKLEGIKNRPISLYHFQLNYFSIQREWKYSSEHVSTSSKAECDLLITYVFANCSGKSSYKFLLRLLTKRLLNAQQLYYDSFFFFFFLVY